jgi:hypothetical protein
MMIGKKCLILTIVATLTALCCCHDNESVINIGDSFATVTRGIDIVVQMDNYPGLNQTAELAITSSFASWYLDTLVSAGIDSVRLGPIFHVQENNNSVDDAFDPQSGTFLWSEVVSVTDTTRWLYDLKPLKIGRFSMTFAVGVVGLAEMEHGLKEQLRHANGISDLYLCIEENHGYECPPASLEEGAIDLHH